MNSRFSIELIRTVAGFRAIEREWNDLFSRSAYRTIFQTHAWHSAWIDAYLEANEELQIVVLRSGSQPKLIAPFCLTPQKNERAE